MPKNIYKHVKEGGLTILNVPHKMHHGNVYIPHDVKYQLAYLKSYMRENKLTSMPYISYQSSNYTKSP